MKTLAIIAACALSSIALGGNYASFEGLELDKKACPGQKILSFDHLECTGAVDAAAVKKARRADEPADLEALGIELDFHGAVELGLIDDVDTSMVYGYEHALLDVHTGKLVGIMSVGKWVNEETHSEVSLVARYNKLGKLVSAKFK